MSFNMFLWSIENDSLKEIPKSKLSSEQRLENWIEENPALLGIEVAIIGRQVTADYGGRIDLLGINSEGDLIIIELKRDKTPREVVAQVLDYASWVSQLNYKRIDEIAGDYNSKSLSEIFVEQFHTALPEKINSNHSMVIVASELDESTERILQYLANEHDININAVFFNYFKTDDRELLGRAWLMNPELVEEKTKARNKAPWSGFWYFNVGDGETRTWEDNVKYSFICAGQGKWYSDALKRFSIGDHFFAYMKDHGYVGYGKILSEPVMIKDFKVNVNGREEYLLDQQLKASNPQKNKDDPELSNYAMKVEWIKTFERDNARTYIGIFANQNVVCKLRDEQTVEFLKNEFGLSDNDME